MGKSSTFLFSMWPVPIVGQPCREKFIKQLKHFPTLLRFRTDENLISYLIDYLSADLREKPLGRAKKTQADHLPTFMKTAKNRERIVKLLKKLQEG